MHKINVRFYHYLLPSGCRSILTVPNLHVSEDPVLAILIPLAIAAEVAPTFLSVKQGNSDAFLFSAHGKVSYDYLKKTFGKKNIWEYIS